MKTKTDFLTLGKPRFNTPELAKIAVRDGIEAAWRQAFQRSGSKAPEGVSGDFAVALREPTGRVFLAIDRFAMRTLCYCQVGDQLRFAERADELADSNTEIDPQAIFDYLYSHATPSPRTIFKGVYRVPPAHYVLFEDGKLTVAPYWTPSFIEDQHPSFDRLRDEFRHLLQQATERQPPGRVQGRLEGKGRSADQRHHQFDVPVKGIDGDLKLNRALWVMAEQMQQALG